VARFVVHASVASPSPALVDTRAPICKHTPGTPAAGRGAAAPPPVLLRECACTFETILVEQTPAHFPWCSSDLMRTGMQTLGKSNRCSATTTMMTRKARPARPPARTSGVVSCGRQRPSNPAPGQVLSCLSTSRKLAISGKFASPSSEQRDAHCSSSFAISAVLFDPPQHRNKKSGKKILEVKLHTSRTRQSFCLTLCSVAHTPMLTMTRLLWKISP
jgi:hypothetical protein